MKNPQCFLGKILLIFVFIFVAACSPTDVLPEQNSTLIIYPSPVSEIAQISVRNKSAMIGLIKVFDPEGRLTFSESAPPGDQTFDVDLRRSSSGKYHVFLELGTSTFSATIYKL